MFDDRLEIRRLGIFLVTTFGLSWTTAGVVFLTGSPQLLLGPTASGLLSMLPWLAVAGWLLWRLERPVQAVA